MTPSTAWSTTSCPDDATTRERIKTLRTGADTTTEYGRLRLALALTLEESCALRSQRNRALRDVDETETERDQLAGRVAELETQVASERALADERLVEVVKLRRRPKVWVVVVFVAGALVVGGAGGYAVGQSSK